MLVSQIESWLSRRVSSGAVGMWGLNSIEPRHQDSAGGQGAAHGSGGLREVPVAPTAPYSQLPAVGSALHLHPL